jgi:16S rRNA (cytosine967-C5)-methyltransferase
VAARWGERAESIAMGLGALPPLDLSLRDPAQTAGWAERLGGVSLAPGHLRLPRGTAIENLEGFSEGAWWVQDLAASLPARLLGAGEGRRVLDLCAAPGGKTLQLAAAGWQVTALDMSAKRLARMAENLERVGLSAETVCADALHWQPDAPFDAVLLDAPCSATGTCRRHPDVLHRIGPRQIDELAELQEALLERASQWVQPGGRLVYAVCSLERDEGEEQADKVGLTPDPVRAEELPAGLEPTPEGPVRTDPGMLAEQGGLDGFFVARWRK